MSTPASATSHNTTTNRRARLLRALRREPVDRPPVIATGGSMTAFSAEVVAQSGYHLPEAHLDPKEMAGLALAVANLTGFECVGLPLCVTLEADALGVPINLGDAQTEARITAEPYQHAADVPRKPVNELLSTGRVPVVLEAIRQLKSRSDDLPIIGNLLGPISVASALVDPVTLLKELRTAKAEVESLLNYIDDFLVALASAFVKAGADIVAIHEDTATPELVGPKAFANVTLPHINRLADHLQEREIPVLLHICGSLDRVHDSLAQLHTAALSPDAGVSLAELRERHPHLALVGNVSTTLLHRGTEEAIAKTARIAIQSGAHVVSPACSMVSATPLANIHALTQTVANS